MTWGYTSVYRLIIKSVKFPEVELSPQFHMPFKRKKKEDVTAFLPQSALLYSLGFFPKFNPCGSRLILAAF